MLHRVRYLYVKILYVCNNDMFLYVCSYISELYSMIGFIEGIRLTYIPDELSNKRSVLCARHQGIVGDLQPLTEDMQ